MVSVIRKSGNNLVRNEYKICDHGRYCRQVDNSLPEKELDKVEKIALNEGTEA